MEYTPKIINDRYVLFVAQAIKCPICEKLMVKKVPRDYYTQSFFPGYINMNQDAQMNRAGLVYISDVKVDDCNICVECKESGKADFKCDLCGERKPTEKIQESFGYPPDFLCKDCYDTTPAKIWEEKIEQLESDHRYDFE